MVEFFSHSPYLCLYTKNTIFVEIHLEKGEVSGVCDKNIKYTNYKSAVKSIFALPQSQQPLKIATVISRQLKQFIQPNSVFLNSGNLIS